MECFSGKRNNFVPIFRLSPMIFTRIRKLHEQCMRHWPGTVCAALTLLSVPLLLLLNVEESTVCPGLSGSLLLDAPLFREPAPLASGVTAPLLPTSTSRNMAQASGTCLHGWGCSAAPWWWCQSDSLPAGLLVSGSRFPSVEPDSWRIGVFNLVILLLHLNYGFV